MTRTTSRIALGAAFGLLAVGAPLPATLAAQPDGTPRPGWGPFLGCWEPEGSDVATEGVLCLVPEGRDVEMLTIVDGELAFREPFVADGEPRDVERDGCRGAESARFSADGRRLYTRSNLTCSDGSNPLSTGLIAMSDRGEWIDVRAVGPRGNPSTWSRWYRRTSDDVLDRLGFVAAAPEPTRVFGAGRDRGFANRAITVADVIDASDHVDAEVVEGWIAATGQPFRSLDADDLVRLDDAGVAPSVIDVVVAVSFPERFALGGERTAAPVDDRSMRRAPRTIWAMPYDPFYGSYYGGYGYGGLYRYGYGYGYGSPWGVRYRPVVVEVDRTPRSSGGRVVAGQGYRGPRRTDAPSGGWAGSGSVRSRPSGGSSSPPPSTKGSGGAKVRKAKPRGGGR